MTRLIRFPRRHKRLLAWCALAAGLALFSTAHAADNTDAAIRAAFEKGTLSEGQRALETSLAARPAEADRLRYALGIVRFLRAGKNSARCGTTTGCSPTG